MKIKSIALGIVAMLIIAGGLIAVQAGNNGNGNGAPSGFHYNINIIGVPHDMNENFDGGNGARIFVDREETTWFYVHGADQPFEICDHDATDNYCGSSRADPGIIIPYTGGSYDVQIYVRLLGPADSSLKWRSYKWEDEDWVQFGAFTLNREDKKFQVKTDDLLADGFEDILWEMYDKTNFRHLQMRIYLEET